jgi:hypothetical protein
MTIAGRTFLELQQEVLEFQFAEQKYRPLTKKWLNDAQRIAARQSEIRTSQGEASYTTESGVAELELPEDFARFIGLSDTDSPGELAPLELADLDGMSASSGRPTAYVASGNDLLLYPTPDGEYPLRLRYWKVPADMADDGDTPSIPAPYHADLTAYALMKAYARENDYQASKFWKEEWEAALGKLRGEAQSDMFDGPRQVPGAWETAPVVPRG